ncbi:MAG: aldehyde dehydrogenase, partial [Rikenellaceae bacterium]|nr:aldehyde dehydrogenase [Rikenellaceae bacterium]
MKKEQIIHFFGSLGERLAHFGEDSASRQAIADAVAANSWFSEREIRHAVEALRIQMLDEDRLRSWLDHYPTLPVATPRKVLVVMAGNIPLVGFFDLLCILASGNRCLVKPSSKDRILMQFVIDQLREIDPQVAVELFDGNTTPDAVIATGSNNAVRHFQAEYGSLPMLLRGSRS